MAEVKSEASQQIAEQNVSDSVKLDPAQNTAAPETLTSENGASKREREEEDGNGDDEASKKPKVEVEEEEEEEEKPRLAKLGPKEFESGEAMFYYFFNLLHHWPTNLDINKYEHMVLLDLLNKGHAEPDKKIGEGIQCFQVRFHPMWKSRCFFLVRVDGTSDDFSFRKCVDQILPLPDSMKTRSSSDAKKLFDNKKSGGNQKGGGGGGGDRGGGRGRRGYGRRGGFKK